MVNGIFNQMTGYALYFLMATERSIMTMQLVSKSALLHLTSVMRGGDVVGDVLR